MNLKFCCNIQTECGTNKKVSSCCWCNSVVDHFLHILGPLVPTQHSLNLSIFSDHCHLFVMIRVYPSSSNRITCHVRELKPSQTGLFLMWLKVIGHMQSVLILISIFLQLCSPSLPKLVPSLKLTTLICKRLQLLIFKQHIQFSLLSHILFLHNHLIISFNVA